MSNKSFVVQYVIKAREQYAIVANKVKDSTDRMRRSLRETNRTTTQYAVATRDAARGSALWGASMQVTNRRARDLRATVQRGAREARNWGAGVAVAGVFALNSLKNAARDAEETRSKFQTVFSSVREQAGATAKALAAGYGLSSTAAQALLADTGDLLTGFGFSQQSALDLSTQVNTLAVDLASFTNFSGGAEGASAALTKALLGERESLKSLGVAILDKDVKQKVATMRANGSRFASMRQAKAVATLALAVEQSKNAIGDFSRTQEELANQERITAAAVDNLASSFGAALTPAALLFNKVIQATANWLDGLGPTTKKWAAGLAIAVVVVAALAAVIGGVLLLLPALSVGFAAVGAVMAGAFWPVVTLVALFSAAAYLLRDDWAKVAEFFSGFAAGLRTTFGPTVSRLVEDFKEAAAVIAELFGSDGEAATSLAEFSNLGELMGTIIGTTLDVIIRGISGVGAILGQVVGAFVSLDFGQFDIDAIKAEFMGTQAAPVQTQQRVDVGVSVGLDKGLAQTGGAVVQSTGPRRGDVGAAL